MASPLLAALIETPLSATVPLAPRSWMPAAVPAGRSVELCTVRFVGLPPIMLNVLFVRITPWIRLPLLTLTTLPAGEVAVSVGAWAAPPLTRVKPFTTSVTPCPHSVWLASRVMPLLVFAVEPPLS